MARQILDLGTLNDPSTGTSIRDGGQMINENFAELYAASLPDFSNYALISHVHVITDVTGLQTALDGKVDDAQVLTNVPVGALFTDTDNDTIYDDTAILSAIALNTAKDTNIAHPLVETAVPLGALFTDTDNDTIYDDTAILAAIALNTAKDTDVVHPLVETAVPSGALFTDTIYTLPFVDNSSNWNTAFSWGNHIGIYEDDLGNPATDGFILTSTIAGVRTWVANSGGISHAPSNGSEYVSKDGVWAVATGSGGGVTDHTLLTNIGTNTHIQIDTHISDGALHTDTIYDDTAILSAIALNTAKDTNIAHPLVETAVPIGALFTDSDTIYDDTAILAAIALNTAKDTDVSHPLVETAVPLGAVFTDNDTVYDDTAILAAIALNTAKDTNVVHPLVETAVPVGALFTDNDTIYDDSALVSAIALNTLKETNIAHPLVETAVPIGALFTDTDTVYDDTAILSAIALNTLKETNIAHPLVETAVPVGALFTDNDTIYDDTSISAAVALNTLKVGVTNGDVLIAGATLSNGNWCYLNSSGKMVLADASAEATASGLIRLATESLVLDDTSNFLKDGNYTTTGLTVGATYYLSETAGQITATRPTATGAIIRPIGVAISTTVLNINISNSYIELT